MKHNRLLPPLIPLLVLVFLEFYFFSPKSIYVSLVLINLLIFFPLWQFSRASQVDKEWWNFFILPAVFSTSLIAYSTLLRHSSLVQALFFLNIVILYFYLRSSYYYFLRPSAYKVSAIENISSYGNFIAFFLLASTIYGLQSFIDAPLWLLMLILAAASILIIYQVVWANKVKRQNKIIYVFIGCLILVELGWSISFLPLNYNVAGLTLAICYYMLIGMIRFHLLDKLDIKRIKLYIGFGLASILIILLTSRWL